jgi:hypothetical protein
LNNKMALWAKRIEGLYPGVKIEIEGNALLRRRRCRCSCHPLPQRHDVPYLGDAIERRRDDRSDVVGRRNERGVRNMGIARRDARHGMAQKAGDGQFGIAHAGSRRGEAVLKHMEGDAL